MPLNIEKLKQIVEKEGPSITSITIKTLRGYVAFTRNPAVAMGVPNNLGSKVKNPSFVPAHPPAPTQLEPTARLDEERERREKELVLLKFRDSPYFYNFRGVLVDIYLEENGERKLLETCVRIPIKAELDGEFELGDGVRSSEHILPDQYLGKITRWSREGGRIPKRRVVHVKSPRSGYAIVFDVDEKLVKVNDVLMLLLVKYED